MLDGHNMQPYCRDTQLSLVSLGSKACLHATAPTIAKHLSATSNLRDPAWHMQSGKLPDLTLPI